MIPLTPEKIRQLSIFSILAFWITLSFSPALSEAVLWTAFGLWLISLIWRRECPQWPDRIAVIFLALFFASAAASLGVTDYMKQSTRGLMKLVRHVIIFFMIYDLFSDQTSRRRWRFILLAGCALIVTDGMIQLWRGTDILRNFPYEPSGAGPRLTAGLGNYGKLAAYLCVMLPPVLFYTVQKIREKWKCRLTAALVLLSGGGVWLLFATKSRGAFVAFFTAIFLTLLFRKSWKILAVLIVSAAVFIAVLPREKIIHLDANNQEQSIVERLELWHRAFDVVQARPLLGTGINTYAVAHQQFDTRKNWRVQNYYAHNGYLQTAAEIGLPGLFFLLAFFSRWLWLHRPRTAAPADDIRWGILGGLLAFLIFCAGDTALHSPQPVMTFWYALGLLGAFSQTRGMDGNHA